jgi:hypothetical protein
MRSFYLCYDMLNLEKFCFYDKVISDCCFAVLVYKSAVSCFGFSVTLQLLRIRYIRCFGFKGCNFSKNCLSYCFLGD